MLSDHELAHTTEPYGTPRHYDALVVGGGPAGLVAARTLAHAGGRVAIVEESDDLGGQYFKRRQGDVLARYGDYRPEGTQLIREVREAGVECLTGRFVWGVGDDGRTLLTTSTTSADYLALRAGAVIVATGAHERAVPFPGWQLPGVVTPGHALHLATCDAVAVGRRVLVAGTGPFLLPVACALLDRGCDVEVAELNRPYRAGVSGLSALRYPRRLRELAGYLAILARHRVPIRQGWRVHGAGGAGAVEQVRLVSARGEEVDLAVDALAVGYGFRPSVELLRLLGCRTGPGTGGDQVPLCDSYGRTSVSGTYAAGEAAGVAGVHAAQVRGYLAAAAAAADLGMPKPSSRSVAKALRRSRALDEFAALTARLFPVPTEVLTEVADETMVCRCEGVTAGSIRAAARSNDQNAVKGFTRAGMGPCQGRECGTAVAALVAAAGGEPAAFPARSPIKPITVAAALGALADEDTHGQG